MDDAQFEIGRNVAERIAGRWGLNHDQIDVLLGNDIEKISYVLGIYKALRIIYPTEERANAWPAKPNRAFGGRSAVDLMLEGDLARVRRYLDGQCFDVPEEMESAAQAVRALRDDER
ncbi:MbcA/ParS/Xre antitoxin family protein [Marinobacter sp. G11]|uniref:MbcA/ParS/Xre antitoxin family protein n=1 Tax=Marinobacter sp. G11 TaxID=2903522 RepID=UPI001E56312A|nr:MbcA/ParS/Xre antitoxin family protein [Marinobacter sp. G11]MCE0760976.1 MbcA/ParS/Xre antitoxin family protein [Marinobacter sp. G11]